eukprot:1159291-Pelagomonas_calceolata.AAC.3
MHAHTHTDTHGLCKVYTYGPPGLQATGHTKEQIEAHAQYHKGDAAMRRLQAKDDLKEHPVVKDFLSWQENHKVCVFLHAHVKKVPGDLHGCVSYLASSEIKRPHLPYQRGIRCDEHQVVVNGYNGCYGEKPAAADGGMIGINVCYALLSR